MKRFICIAFTALVILSCVSAPKSSLMAPDDVVQLWAKSLEGKNLDVLMTTYWSDAVVVIPGDDDSEQRWTGSEEIRGLQSGTTENPDLQLVIRLDTSERAMKGDTAVYTIEVEAGDSVIINTLKLEKRGSEWRIIYQTLEV